MAAPYSLFEPSPDVRIVMRTDGRTGTLLVANHDGSVSAFQLELEPMSTETPAGSWTQLRVHGRLLESRLFESVEEQAVDWQRVAGAEERLRRVRDLVTRASRASLDGEAVNLADEVLELLDADWA